jgi:hypothetical protein
MMIDLVVPEVVIALGNLQQVETQSMATPQRWLTLSSLDAEDDIFSLVEVVLV